MKYSFNEIEHLHLLDGVALTGTSSITGVLAKPLSYWAAGKTLEPLGWINSKLMPDPERIEIAKEKLSYIKGLVPKEYVELLDKCYKNHAVSLKDSAKKGVDLHAELERYVKNTIKFKFADPPYDDRIKPFIEWSQKNVKKFVASEAHCYSERLWLGGIIDCVAEMNDGTLAIIDFKSAKEAYVSHHLQTCLYGIQLMENGLFSSDGLHNKKLDKNVEKLIIFPFGAEKVEPSIRNYSEFIEGAECAVKLYRLLGYDKKIKENE